MVHLEEREREEERVGLMFRIALYILGALVIVTIGLSVVFL